jgi:hypothetical protein
MTPIIFSPAAIRSAAWTGIVLRLWVMMMRPASAAHASNSGSVQLWDAAHKTAQNILIKILIDEQPQHAGRNVECTDSRLSRQ